MRDFLPFVKQVFETLFKTQPIQAVALSSTYALKHTRTVSSAASGSVFASQLMLGMELDVTALAEPLRSIAPSVFEENESLQQAQQLHDQENITELENS